jgi:outer membrane protein OmpA-like peptidoglycan-associated protein
MTTQIFIPGLKNSVSVTVGGAFDPDGENVPLGFKGNVAKVAVSDKKRRTRLWIKIVMSFPPDYNKERDFTSKHYWHIVDGAFEDIDQADGKLLFSDGEIKLDGPAAPPEAPADSLFRFIDATAWLSKGDNPRVTVVKVKLSVGSPEVYVLSHTDNYTEPVWKTGGGGGFDLGPEDIPIKLDGKWERTGRTDSHSDGTSLTVAQLSAQPVFTIFLELPEPKPVPPPPGPFGLPEPYTFYFETGKSNADNYRSPLSGSWDQIKGLQMYLDDIDKQYGLDNIDSAEVTGYASGLGDTRGNLNLSADRARYVVDLISTLRINIPRTKLVPKGEPINASDKDDNPHDRRAELLVRIKGSARH